MFSWKPARDSASLKGHVLSETLLQSQLAERGRTLANAQLPDREPTAPRSAARPDHGAAQRLDYRQAAPAGCRPGEKSPLPYGGQDFVKMTATACGRLPLTDPRTRQYAREPHLAPNKPQPAPDTGYSNVVPSSISAHSSAVPHHPHPHAHQSPYPHQSKDVAPKRAPSYGPPTPNDVTVVDREARRSMSQELHIDAARVATGQHVSLPVSGPPASSVGIVQDWLRQVPPFGAPAPPNSSGCSPTRRGSLSGKQPEVTSQLEYSPPLDLSLKQLNGKRRAPEVTDDDQPLDLSVKRQKKEVEESDDDVILVGVHNPPNSAGYPGGSAHPNQATGSYDKRHVPMAHLGAPSLPTRPVTSDSFQPIQGRYSSPRPMPVATGAGYRVTANASKHVIDAPYHVAKPAMPLPYSHPTSPAPAQSRLGNPMMSQPRMPSPLHRQPVPVPTQPAPAPQQNSIRDNRQGVPLVWGLEHPKNPKSDARNAPSQYHPAEARRRDAPSYRGVPAAGRRVQDLGLESRVGPPETYQGPSGQERHIQRIDKHQELLAYGKQPSGSTWIPPAVCNGDVYQQGVRQSPAPAVPLVPQRTTRTDGLARKEPTPERCPSSGRERSPYLDPAPGPARYGVAPGPYTAAVSGSGTAAPARQEAPKNGGKCGGGAAPQVSGGNRTLSYIPKYVVTVQGNKLYQHPKPERPYHELMASAVPSTVEEPVRLTERHPYPVTSVPIIKEENALPGKTTPRTLDPKALAGDASAKSERPSVDVGAPPARVDVDAVAGGQPSQAAPATAAAATNMVSKTESKFVSAAHKMIPVANVHPIRKLTSEADENSLPEAKKDDDKEEAGDGKRADDGAAAGELHQKIQITPNPLFGSHQDEFVRFLSRSAAVAPNSQRFSKKQLKMLTKSGLDGFRSELLADRHGRPLSPALRGRLAELHELERVPRDLALHFSTPKGRHKLLTKRNSRLFDGGPPSAQPDAAGREGPVGVGDDAPPPTPPEKNSDSQPALETSATPDGVTRKKAKGKRRKQPAEPSGRIPYKKRRRRQAEPVDEGGHPPGDGGEAAEGADRAAGEHCVAEVGCKKSRRYVNRQSRGQSDVARRTYRRKNQRVMTRHKALRKSRRVALYDKNAAYEAELRKEEERRLLRRVKREERSHLLPPPSSSSSSSSTSSSSQAGDGQGELRVGADDLQPTNDAETDDVTDVESSDNAGQAAEARALRSAKQRAARKLSLRKRVGCRKRKMLRDARFSADAVVELHPLSMRAKVKAKRLPMEKVMRRRLRKEARACVNNNNNNNNNNHNNNYSGNSRTITDNVDKKRLFVCRETGETTLHKAARKGYVDAALQCLDSEMVDVNVRDNAGYTPLHESCVSGSLAIAKALIARGADANAKALDGTRPLHDAVDNNHIELVRLLLSQGADPTIANYGGRTPLKLARSTNMKAFISDYLADLRDEGPDWELSSFIGRQGDELGFDVLEGAPDSSCSDPGCEAFFDLCADPPLPMFFLRVDNKTGPRNYHLLNDVCSRLAVVNKEDFMLLNNDLRFVEIGKSAMSDQLRANPLCRIDDQQLEQLEDVVQLVEIDSTLCQLLEVSRENLGGEGADDSGSCPDIGEQFPELSTSSSSSSSSTSSSRKAACDPDADPDKDGDESPEPDVIGTRSGRLTPPASRPKERRRTPNMRKSKSCTSLDMCDWNKTAVLRLTALNRSESSPNVQDPSPRSPASAHQSAAASCSALRANSDRRQGRCRKSEPCGGGGGGGSPVRSKARHHHQHYRRQYSERAQLELDKAVLCNEMALTMTALAREVTKTVLAREVNRKVRLSSGRLAVDAPTAWNSRGPTSAKSAVGESRCGGVDVGDGRADGQRELAGNRRDSALGRGAPDDAGGGSDVGSVPGPEPEEATDGGPAADREPTPRGGARSTSGGQSTAEPTAGTQAVAAAASHDGAPVAPEMALPVLENPFEEEEGKQAPSVTNEGGGLEEREMPELTLCTY